MPFYLGIDAGGTSTRCAVANETEVLAIAKGGSIKVTRVSKEQARQALRAVLSHAAESAGVRLDEIAATCIGISGCSVPAVSAWLRDSIHNNVSGKLMLCCDDEIALDAAFPGQCGVLTIAGTGSNTIARTSTGERVNVGGWGPVLGDPGSGYWIGREGLRAAMRAWDRGEKPILLERVRHEWQANDIWGVVEKVESGTDLAAIAPLVDACAESGDSVSTEVLIRGGRLLGEDIVLAFHKMRAIEPNLATSPGVAFAGSIAASCKTLRTAMVEEVRRQLPAIHIQQEMVDPIHGAIWRARRTASEPV